MNHTFSFKKITALLLAVVMMISMCGIAEGGVVAFHNHEHMEAVVGSILESTGEPAAEPTEEPVVEATEEPAAEPTEEPVVEATEEPVAEATEEPAAEPTEEPVVEATEEPAAEPTEEPVVEATEEPAEETEEVIPEEPTEETEEETTEEPAEDMDVAVDVPVDMPMMMAVYNAADVEGECEHNFENGVCSLCSAVCAHENRVNVVVTWTDIEECYVPDDDEDHSAEHMVSGTKITTFDCADCDKTGIENKEWASGKAPHEYENGICSLCDYVNENLHTCIPIEEIHTEDIMEIVSKNADGHTVVYQIHKYTYCKHGDYRKSLSDEYYAGEPTEEPHD